MFVLKLVLVVFAGSLTNELVFTSAFNFWRQGKCRPGVDHSRDKFCSADACSSPETTRYCCLMTYVRPDESEYDVCLCPPAIRCIEESQKETDQRSLCDEADYRVLNSRPMKQSDRCQFGAVASLTVRSGQTVTCNAVLTRAKVGGVHKVTFATSHLCKEMVDALSDDSNAGLVIQMGPMKEILKSPFKTVAGRGGSAFIDIKESDLNKLAKLTECETPACAYKPSRMSPYVDTNNCKMISYGASDADSVTFNGIREVDLERNYGGCRDLPDLFRAARTECYKSKSGKALFCVGDSGAPVFCKSTLTNEWILMGVAAHQTVCGGSSEVKVISIPI